MPRLITERELRDAIQKGTFIQDGKLENAEGVKYDFRMGNMLLKSEFGKPIDVSRLSEEHRGSLCVQPGEAVFVLTMERLELSGRMKALLSPKRKLSHEGIMVLGGFCIDPLYKGRLLVGLYNFSSSPFPLIPGKKLIAALFYELRDDELAEFAPPEAAIEDFPDDLVRLMRSYSPVSTQSLLDQLHDLGVKFEELRTEFRERADWFERIAESIEKHDQQIDKLLEGLDKERDQRVASEKQFERQLSEYSQHAYKTAGLVGALGAVLLSFFFFLIQRLLQGG